MSLTNCLTPEQYNELIKLIIDFCQTENERRALITSTFGGKSVSVDYTGNPQTFCPNCLDALYRYDYEHAVLELLENLRNNYLGPSRKSEAQVLIDALRACSDAEELAEIITTASPDKQKPIFISYSRDNSTFVKKLRADLEKYGIHYWIDKVGLVPGTMDWEEGLRNAIEKSQGMILIASPESRKSRYVRDEVALAELHKKRIYPVWAKGKEWLNCIPMGRSHIQNIDMRERAYDAGLKQLIAVLKGASSEGVIEPEAEPSAPPTEPENPYKGLFAFREEDADKFFGRTALTENMAAQLKQQLDTKQARFCAVLGPSGAGKSSVVMAGLIPALRKGELILGSDQWAYLPSIVPGTHPLENLADALKSHMPDTPLSSIETDLNAPGGRMLHRLVRQLEHKRVVLYIDQFEELFTLVESERERQQFIALISQSVSEPDGKLIVILSMRSDFFGHPFNYPLLGDLFDQHATSVKPMSIDELRSAIVEPARLPNSRLAFDDGLVAEIIFALRGRDRAIAGALPLLQFTLERLFEERDGNHLTRQAYEDMGGVEGAIGTHSESVFQKLSKAAQEKLGEVFLPLTNIDEETDEPTRRRAPLAIIVADTETKQFVDAFVKNRLLQTGRDDNTEYLEIAHEALFRSWDRLVGWIADTRDDLRLLRQVIQSTKEWDEQGRPAYLRWNHERLIIVYEMIERLEPECSEIVQLFIEPEQDRLYRELEDVTTSHQRRFDIGERLNRIGDTRKGVGLDSEGFPDIEWCLVNTTDVEIEGKNDSTEAFYISKYPITYIQFSPFLQSTDIDIAEQYFRADNNPREQISWEQATAYTIWLSENLGYEVRLPTEIEWQAAATGGDIQKAYPWGSNWDSSASNTLESGLSRTTAVGLYPKNITECGVMDMCGNIEEWTSSKYMEPSKIDGIKYNRRILRGGSWKTESMLAKSTYRFRADPQYRSNNIGFRICTTYNVYGQLQIKRS